MTKIANFHGSFDFREQHTHTHTPNTQHSKQRL